MKKLLILIAVFSYFNFHNNQIAIAEENLEASDLVGTNSETITKAFTIYENYSLSVYNMDRTNGYVYRPFPTRIYKIIDGYVGYVTLQEFYQDKSFYRATYVGLLQKRSGPSVPLLLDDKF
ncbi:hypothetical protein AB4027_03265 [Alkalibacterium putridalgicola]|uniref:hypothetical protein n=1 Tax=Alkalibacterium putridalgicola TaxID=426703 RepID=UPI0034CDE53C